MAGATGRTAARTPRPARQAALIAEALDRLGVGRVIVVGHSLAGAVATSFALDHEDAHGRPRAACSAVTHPWPGGITWYYRAGGDAGPRRPLRRHRDDADRRLGPRGCGGRRLRPGKGPADYAAATAAALVLRPDEFRWNGQDVAALKAFVTAQAPRYGEIHVPTAVIASEEDSVVSTVIHSRPSRRRSLARG